MGLKPGDATFWGGTINDYHHSAIYAGVATSGRFKGQPVVWDALDNNIPVQEHTMGNLIAEGYTYEGAYRYSAGTVPVLTITTTSLPGGTAVYNTTPQIVFGRHSHATAGHPPYRWSLGPRIEAPASRPDGGVDRGHLEERPPRRGPSPSCGPSRRYQHGERGQADRRQNPHHPDHLAAGSPALLSSVLRSTRPRIL